MARRTIDQMRLELQRLMHCIEAADEAEGQIEEVEHEMAQATPSFFLLISYRFVSDNDDAKPTEWEHEVVGISKETAFNRFTMRFKATKDSVQIRFYDAEDLILTVNLNPNERVQLNTPCFADPGETQFILSAFKTYAEAEECQCILEEKRSKAETTTIN